MSDPQGSTSGHEEELRRFELNPVGHRIQLYNGKQGVVREYRDTPKGRWYRLARGGWVPSDDVEGVIVFSIGLKDPPATTTRVMA